MTARRPLPVWLALATLLLATACAKPTKPEGVSDSPQHHYSIGMKLLETGERGRAKQEFERARALDPKYAPAYEGLGLVALAEKDYKSAESLLDESKRRDGKYVPAYLGLAKVHAAKGDRTRPGARPSTRASWRRTTCACTSCSARCC